MTEQQLTTYSHQQHKLPTQHISNAAQDIIGKLNAHGYKAYIVGGAVRDLLLGLTPKDFDISTDATPDEIKGIFKKRCRIIGRRFRLAHIYQNNNVYEVATFRGSQPGKGQIIHKGQIIRDNVFGSIDQDAWRRDFTCNALYLDLHDNTILDYVGGVDDIRKGRLTLIGKPAVRYQEDPVRILRAIRFSSKLGLDLGEQCKNEIPKYHQSLLKVPSARLFDEIIKIFHCGQMAVAFERMMECGLFQLLFPDARKLLEQDENSRQMLQNAFRNTDRRLANDQSVTPVFLLSCVLWLEFKKRYHKAIERGRPPYETLHQVTTDLMENQRRILAIPKSIQAGIRQIWMLQLRFKRMHGKRVFKTLNHPRFRAAYDFLLLRAESYPELAEEADFWTKVQEQSPDNVRSMIFSKATRNRKITPELP